MKILVFILMIMIIPLSSFGQYALQYDGDNDYAQTPDHPFETFGTTHDFAYSFWALLPNIQYAYGPALFINNNADVRIIIRNDGAAATTRIDESNVVRVNVNSDTGVLPTDSLVWHNYIFSIDVSDANNCLIFVDGVEVSSYGTRVATENAKNMNGTAWIGRWSSIYSAFSCDDFAVWRGVLVDQANATAIYNGGETRNLSANYGNYSISDSLKGYWRFNEGTGQVAADEVASQDYQLGAGAGPGSDDPTWVTGVPEWVGEVDNILPFSQSYKDSYRRY